MSKIEEAQHSIAESEKHIRELKQHIQELGGRGSVDRTGARKLLAEIQTLLETKPKIFQTLQSIAEANHKLDD